MDYDSDLPILGFRRWRIKGPRHPIPEHSLIGSWRDTVWSVGEPTVAKCRAYSSHPDCDRGPLVDKLACKCGLHLFFTMADAQAYSITSGDRGHVIGIVAGGGRVLFDAKYARCEIAEPVVLIDPAEYGPQLFRRRSETNQSWEDVDDTERIRQWTVKTAERYGLPMLPLYDAMAHAQELGVFVDGVKDLENGETLIEGVD